MRIKEKYLVVAFDTTEQALFAEKICRQDNIDGRLIPLPKAVDAGCGLCWASKNNPCKDKLEKYLLKRNIKYRKIAEVIF